MNEQWTEWLSSLSPEQISFLKKELTEDSAKPKITRLSVEELMVHNHPPYIDVFNLHQIYDAYCFNCNMIVKGPKGDGKTLSVIAYAKQKNIPLVIQECSEDTKKMDLFGSSNFVGKETIFTLGAIPTAIDVANEHGSCILLIEEINALTPQVQKQLNAITDFRQACSMPFLGKVFKLREGAKIWVVGTCNFSTYGGTYDINEDLKSRFEELELNYPSKEQEKLIIESACAEYINTPITPIVFLEGSAKINIDRLERRIIARVIQLAGESRKEGITYALSTRDIVRVIQSISRVGLQSALQIMLFKFDSKEDRSAIVNRIESIFGNHIKLQNCWK